MSIEFIEAQLANKEEWDYIVDNTPMGTIFHKWDWLKLIADELKIKLILLFLRKDSKTIGLLPLFSSKRIFMKIYFSPPPNSFIPFLGPIFSDYDKISNQDKEKLMETFVSSLLKNFGNAALLRIKLNTGLTDVREFLWNKSNIIPLYDYCIDLTPSLTQIFAKLSKSLLRHQKKLEKDTAYCYRLGDLTEIQVVAKMVKERYVQQSKIMPLTENYFEKLANRFPDELKIFILEFNSQIVGGLIALIDKQNIYLWLGSTNKASNKSANDYLFYEVIRWAKYNNLEKFYIIGANTKNINQFKSKYNGELVLRFLIEKKSFFFSSLYSVYKIFNK